jgi:uncharacterized OsmC-like protein
MAEPIIPARGPPTTQIAKAGIDPATARGRVDLKAVRTLTCRTVARGRLQQLNYIRDLPPQTVREDEPGGLSSETSAPNASEALLAALGSCLAVGIHANALAQNIPVHSLELQISADINTATVWGAGNLTPKTIGFETIRVSVRLVADAPRNVLETLVRHTTLWSPVANTIHNPVHLDVTLEPDAAIAA